MSFSNEKGNIDVIKRLVEAGMDAIGEELKNLSQEEEQKVTPIDMFIVGHNILKFIANIALDALKRTGKLSDEESASAYYQSWVSIISTLLQDTIGLEDYVDQMLEEREEGNEPPQVKHLKDIEDEGGIFFHRRNKYE